ncbi:hypothetical protein ACFLUA_04090 [Chloroflexota bacterium]
MTTNDTVGEDADGTSNPDPNISSSCVLIRRGRRRDQVRECFHPVKD